MGSSVQELALFMLQLYLDNPVKWRLFELLPLLQLAAEHQVVTVVDNVPYHGMVRVVCLDYHFAAFVFTPCPAAHLCH